MRIDNINLEPPGSGRTTLATFDVEVSPDITLRNWILRLTQEGQIRCFPPRTRRAPAYFAVAQTAGRMNAAVIAAYRQHGGPLANGTTSTT